MSVFKQAHSTILSTVSKLKEDNYSSQASSSKPTRFSAFTATEANNKQIKTQNAAQKIINMSPTSAKGYLASTQIYQEQGDLNSALSICTKGLKLVSLNDQQYSLLIKEKQKVAVKVKQKRQGGFFGFLKYDILYKIFGNLEAKDLLNCTHVCRRWTDFMMEWPGFWAKMALIMPNINQSTLTPLLQGKAKELRLEGPIDTGLIHDIFWFLSLWEDNNCIQKIDLRNLKISTWDVSLLVDAIRCMSPSLKQIEWTNCEVQQIDILQYILPACSSGLTYVSFSRNKKTATRYNIHHIDGVGPFDTYDFSIALYRTPEKHTSLSSSAIDGYYSTLTYLKVSAEGHRHCHPGEVYVHSTALIKKSPNLIHILLDSNGTGFGRLRECFLQAIKSCPQLETLLIFENADMPETIITGATGYTTAATGVRRFVFSHNDEKLQPKDVLQAFKKYHASLELLYLDNGCRSLSTTLLAKLASFGCPNLREIRITTSDYNVSLGRGPKISDMPNVLDQLFSACSNLEAIELDDTCRWKYNYIHLTTSMVEAIANKCPTLRQLHFYSNYYNWSNTLCKSFLNFVHKETHSQTSNRKKNRESDNTIKQQKSSQLECLKVTRMDFATAQALVKNITSLRYLYIKWWWIDNTGEHKCDDENPIIQEIQDTLRGRGGSLVVDETNNK